MASTLAYTLKAESKAEVSKLRFYVHTLLFQINLNHQCSQMIVKTIDKNTRTPIQFDGQALPTPN